MGIGIHVIDAATVVVAWDVGAAEDQGFAVGGIWVAEPGVAARWPCEDFAREEEVDEGYVEGTHAVEIVCHCRIFGLSMRYGFSPYKVPRELIKASASNKTQKASG